MLQQIIDRRLSGKNKSIGNRERFLRRYKEQIKGAVRRAIDGRGIRDLERGEDIRIPKKDISEPVFHHGQGGQRDMVHPGNQEYVTGDRIARPKSGGGGGGSGKGSRSGGVCAQTGAAARASKARRAEIRRMDDAFRRDFAMPGLYYRLSSISRSPASGSKPRVS